MKSIWLLTWNAIAWGALVVTSGCSLPPSQSTQPTPAVLPDPKPGIRYQSYILPHSVVHTLTIRVDRRDAAVPRIKVAIAPELETVERLARKERAKAALNGGFFDPNNRKSTSYVIQTGKLVADPRDNERLTKNPQLAPYLPQILDRSEFRFYSCGQTVRYEIARRSEPSPAGCRLVEAVSGGPRLLPENTSVREGFLDTAKGKTSRDVLGSNQRNARSAIGITPDGSIVLVMVAQKPEAPGNSGMSLPELTAFMQNLGVETAMNLDGGSSSSLYYQSKTFYGKVDRQGKWVKRPVKSVLLIRE